MSALRNRRLQERKPAKKNKKPEDETFNFLGTHYRKREVYTILLVGLVAAGMIGYWLLNRNYYTQFRADSVMIAGNSYPVTRFRGIEAWNEPGKLRACFKIKGQILAPPATNPQPRAAPGWFKCFYPDRIIEELAAGSAKMYMAQYNSPPGWDRIVVVFDNSRSDERRAFMWRQKNANFKQ